MIMLESTLGYFWRGVDDYLRLLGAVRARVRAGRNGKNEQECGKTAVKGGHNSGKQRQESQKINPAGKKEPKDQSRRQKSQKERKLAQSAPKKERKLAQSAPKERKLTPSETKLTPSDAFRNLELSIYFSGVVPLEPRLPLFRIKI